MVNLNKKIVDFHYRLTYTWLNIFLLLVLCFASVFCGEKKKKRTPAADITSLPQPPGHYDFARPEGMILGDELLEISGIAYISSRTMLAENDEEGRIFSIALDRPRDRTYTSVRFGKKEDYEDIVVIDSTAYILISDGRIVEVVDFATGPRAQGRVIGQVSGARNEFESLYYDKSVNSLIALCKSCRHEKDEIRTAYRFDLTQRQFLDSAYYTIKIADIAQKANDAKVKFFPSAAALHPILNKVYIVSSIGKLLVITSSKGEVEEVLHMNDNAFNQPEGITFAPNGDLYISNEGGGGEATILKFTYKP